MAAESGEGMAVPVLVVDMVPAKRGQWAAWMLELWAVHMEAELEVAVWCNGSQAVELPSAVHSRLVAVAWVAVVMVEVGKGWM